MIRGIDDSLATITKADYHDLTSDYDPTETLEFASQADLEAHIANIKSNESAKQLRIRECRQTKR